MVLSTTCIIGLIKRPLGHKPQWSFDMACWFKEITMNPPKKVILNINFRLYTKCFSDDNKQNEQY